MTSVVGGLRSRLIFDNCYKCLHVGLTSLGWFNTGRHHSPITMVDEEQSPETEVPLNTLALSDEVVSNAPIELGSSLAEMTRYYYLDFFAESDAVGKHLIGDCRDILEGRIVAIGRTGPVLPIYDLRQATPTLMFTCEVDKVQIDRAHNYPHPWLKHWYSIQFVLIDTYSTDADTVELLGGYQSGYQGGNY